MGKGVLIIILMCFNIIGASSQEKGSQKLFVGTFTSGGAEGIYLCDFDASTGKIEKRKTFKGIDNPSFLKISQDKKFLYSVNRVSPAIEPSGGYVTSFKIDENQNLQFLNKQISNGAGPCHIDVSADGKYVAIATYVGGTISLYPVAEDGSLFSSTTTIVNQGSGPNERRQKEPHAHSVKFSPYNNLVFSADLGTDQLNIFELKGNQLSKYSQDSVEIVAGSGPRHFDFHPERKIIYVINELNSTVTAIKNENESWLPFQTLSTLPAGFDGTSYCADIHVSADGRFLYGSNRGHNSIVVFQIDKQSGELNFIQTVSTEGDWPRNFTLSPDGRFLLAANERSGNITVFRINNDTGVPEFTGSELKLPAPVCLEFY